MLERQIEAMQQGADGALTGLKGSPVETAQAQTAALRRELAEAQLTFTDKHPEVIRLREGSPMRKRPPPRNARGRPPTACRS